MYTYSLQIKLVQALASMLSLVWFCLVLMVLLISLSLWHHYNNFFFYVYFQFDSSICGLSMGMTKQVYHNDHSLVFSLLFEDSFHFRRVG